MDDPYYWDHLLGFVGKTRILLFPFRKAEALACYLVVERRASREVLAELFGGTETTRRPSAISATPSTNSANTFRPGCSGRTVQWIVLDLDHDDVDLDLEVLSDGGFCP